MDQQRHCRDRPAVERTTGHRAGGRRESRVGASRLCCPICPIRLGSTGLPRRAGSFLHRRNGKSVVWRSSCRCCLHRNVRLVAVAIAKGKKTPRLPRRSATAAGRSVGAPSKAGLQSPAERSPTRSSRRTSTMQPSCRTNFRYSTDCEPQGQDRQSDQAKLGKVVLNLCVRTAIEDRTWIQRRRSL